MSTPLREEEGNTAAALNASGCSVLRSRENPRTLRNNRHENRERERRDKPAWSSDGRNHTGKEQRTSPAPSHARAVVRPHLKRWIGVYVGEVWSSEILKSGSGRRSLVRNATTRGAITRVPCGPAESKTLRTHRNSTRENREAPSLSVVETLRTGGRRR